MTPEWVTESIKANALLPWTRFRLYNSESSQKQLTFGGGTLERQKSPGKVISEGFETSAEFSKELQDIVSAQKNPGQSQLRDAKTLLIPTTSSSANVPDPIAQATLITNPTFPSSDTDLSDVSNIKLDGPSSIAQLPSAHTAPLQPSDLIYPTASISSAVLPSVSSMSSGSTDLVQYPTATDKELSLGHNLNRTILANEWNRQNSTLNPEFLDNYYRTSRLHYLSMWKAELKEITAKLQQQHAKKKKETEVSEVKTIMWVYWIHYENCALRIGSYFTKKNYRRIRGQYRTMNNENIFNTNYGRHVDFDCFFASVGIRDRPHLITSPVRVL